MQLKIYVIIKNLFEIVASIKSQSCQNEPFTDSITPIADVQ
jgi:hypothetical protein